MAFLCTITIHQLYVRILSIAAYLLDIYIFIPLARLLAIQTPIKICHFELLHFGAFLFWVSVLLATSSRLERECNVKQKMRIHIVCTEYESPYKFEMLMK